MTKQETLLQVLRRAGDRGMTMTELLAALGTQRRATRATIERIQGVGKESITYVRNRQVWVAAHVEQSNAMQSAIDTVRDAGSDGISTRGVASALGVSQSAASNRLYRLHMNGEIIKVGNTGNCVKWVIAGTPVPEQKPVCHVDKRLAEDWGDTLPTHRIVSASSAPRPTVRISSVWDLAA